VTSERQTARGVAGDPFKANCGSMESGYGRYQPSDPLYESEIPC
jgi:hypothetical protein